MNNYLIRFNKSRGEPGRGTVEHVWRVFENGKEFLAKDVQIHTPTWSERTGEDWNIATQGYMVINNDCVTILQEKNTNIPTRSCDGCTKCCQGYLHGSAYEHNFQRGQPCFFVKKDGCSIYENRPVNPCKTFKCLWLAEDVLPMWMRPDFCDAIMVKREYDGVEWYEIHEAGKKLDSSVLSWMMLWAVNNKKNLRYMIDGGWFWVRNDNRT